MDEVLFVSGGGEGDKNEDGNSDIPKVKPVHSEDGKTTGVGKKVINDIVKFFEDNPISGWNSAGENSPIESQYSPPSDTPNVSATIGNNGVQVEGTIPFPDGTTVTGTITVPYNPGPPAWRVEVRFPF
jgi:hypothetical protein